MHFGAMQCVRANFRIDFVGCSSSYDLISNHSPQQQFHGGYGCPSTTSASHSVVVVSRRHSSSSPAAPSPFTRSIGGGSPLRRIADEQSARRLTTRRTASKQQYNVPQQPETVPLWLWICLASYRTAKDALQFLWEQPGQLKFIEWPSFQSTIRMAVLTVVVVALLIVFLATIDSTFSYVLSSMLRRVP